MDDVSAVRIALADDDPTLRFVLVRLLEKIGYSVVLDVANGVELIEQCRDDEVDVALVDLDMPFMDGLAVAEVLSQRSIPVVLISGHDDANSVVVEHEPIVARILKPVTRQALQHAIEFALSTKAPRDDSL